MVLINGRSAVTSPTAAKTAQAIRAITPGMWWMVKFASSTDKDWPIPVGN